MGLSQGWHCLGRTEGFDKSGREFVPVGAKRYGLRGDLLKQIDIKKFYGSPDRQILLSDSGGEIWDSSYTPAQQGIKKCKKVKCPSKDF